MRKDSETEIVIVLGAKVKRGGVPTEALQNRLDAAIAYYKTYPTTTFVVTGGQGPDEDEAEAVVMARYLYRNGVDSRIVIEARSTSTYENLLFTKALLPELQFATIISNDYHVKRAQVLAKKLGIETKAIGAKTPPSIAKKVKVRELFARIKAYSFGK